MDYNELPPGTLAATIEGLLKLGKITENDIALAMIAEPSVEMKHTVDLVHSFMCTQSHGKDASGSGRMCEYYVEDNLAECWSLPAHRQWVGDTAELMKEYNITSVSDIKRAVRIVTDISDMLRKQTQPNNIRFVIYLLKGIMDTMVKRGLPKVNEEPKQIPISLRSPDNSPKPRLAG